MLNCREIDAVLAEFKLKGSRLRKVRQPDFRRIILEFSSETDLSAIALVMAPPYPRLHLLAAGRKLPRALPKPPRFTAVLKSRLEGARLSTVSQLGWDRIVRFSFLRGGEVLYLDAKLWGDGANIILSGSDGIIIDAYSRRPKRRESPGEKWPPDGIGEAAAPADPERFPLRALPGNGSWNLRVEEYYRELEFTRDRDNRIAVWDAYLNRREGALTAREKRIHQGIKRFESQLRDGHWGDIIMAHLHELDKNSSVLEADDWESPESRVRIPLDPKLSPGENAEKYYRRKKRAVRGLIRLKEDLQLLKQTRKNIVDLRSRLRLGDINSEPFNSDPPDRKVQGGSSPNSLPGLWITRPPFLIAVGRNAKESDTLLRHWARGNDLWLHARDYPGGHVFIRAPRGKSIPLEVLLDAGNLALSYSKAKASGEADLYYTHVKYLRRVKSSGPGSGNTRSGTSRGGKTATVLPTHEKNLHIKLDSRRLKALKEAAEIS